MWVTNSCSITLLPEGLSKVKRVISKNVVQRSSLSASCGPVSLPQAPSLGPFSVELEVVCCLHQATSTIFFPGKAVIRWPFLFESLAFVLHHLVSLFCLWGFVLLLFSFGFFSFVFRKLLMYSLFNILRTEHPPQIYFILRNQPHWFSLPTTAAVLPSPLCASLSVFLKKWRTQLPGSPAVVSVPCIIVSSLGTLSVD